MALDVPEYIPSLGPRYVQEISFSGFIPGFVNSLLASRVVRMRIAYHITCMQPYVFP